MKTRNKLYKPTNQVIKSYDVKQCVECKIKTARHWNSSFCEDCFGKILNEHLDNS